MRLASAAIFREVIVVLHGLTIFWGALLLFLVQPLAGKYLLPWFGGGPGVWTVCLLFFQGMLLGGYAYAHLITTRLRPRAQAWVHFALLALALLFLPIIPGAGWKPMDGEAPIAHLLGVLMATVGLPYFVLSATGPLLQRWFTHAQPGTLPYRLYALSNVGSLLALLAYPFVLEPLWSRAAQAWLWSGGMVLFTVLAGACTWRMARRAGAPGEAKPDTAPAAEKIPWSTTAWWLAWPAAASLLLAAVTNKLTGEVAPVPFLWVLPLAAYLASFILCFDHPRWYARGVFAALLALGAGLVALLLLTGAEAPLALQIGAYPAVLLVACMICHGEVHRLRPAARHLTRFYLCLAAGGVLGTLFVAVAAPVLFRDYYDVQIGLGAVIFLIGLHSFAQRDRVLPLGLAAGVVLAFLLAPWLPAARHAEGLALAPAYGVALLKLMRDQAWAVAGGLAALVFCFRPRWRRPVVGEWQRGMPVFAVLVAAGLGTWFFQIADAGRGSVVAASRNFYGGLRVIEKAADQPLERHWELKHGLTTHGAQFRAPERAAWPTTYFGRSSGVGVVLGDFKTDPGRKVGVVGLGAGTIAAYGRAGDRFTFYEIDPAVIRLARAPFTFLSGSAAQIEIVPGDARLALEAQARDGASQRFDVLVLDAFSGDAIPLHLLTVEAMETYLRHLKPDGMIAVHISNRYLDLRGVLVGLARHFQLDFVVAEDRPKAEDYWLTASRWVLLTPSKDLLRPWIPPNPEARKALEDTFHPILWTDDHTSLLSVWR
jgi:SAM-dependent methyltransferase